MTQMTNPELVRSADRVLSTDLALTPDQPLLPATTVGAQEAIAFTNAEWNVHISLYVFEKQSLHRDATTLLKAEIPAAGVYTNVGSNGLVLFVGFTPNDGSNGDPIKAKHRLARVSTVFAGEE